MRILWHSTVPWSSSSYSVLTARTIPNIVRNGGHDVTLSTWYGLSGAPMPWQIIDKNGSESKTVQIIPHHAVGGNTYGEAMLVENYKFTKSEVCMTACDVFVFQPQITQQVNFAPWLPIDTDPVPDGILHALQPAIYPMCYSKWGTALLEAAGVKAHYVPCSAPADVFKPGDKAGARTMFTVNRDYDFLVTMVAANKSPEDRKGFTEALLGFARFLEKHPDAIFYIHTDWGGPIRIDHIAARLGIEKNIIQPNQYALINGLLNEAYMANVYQASDVLLNPAKSEGFGLPLIEAQMCGCPIAATDFATTDELLFAGWKLDGQPDWYVGAESWRKRVYVSAVADALEEAYRNKDNEKLRRKARNGAMRYDNQTVFNQYWKPALAEIETIVNRSKITIPSFTNGKQANVTETRNLVPIQG